MDKRLLIAANVVVALALAYWFLQGIGLQAVGGILAKARVEFILLGAVFYAAMNVLNSFRIAWALKTSWTADLFFKHMTAMLISDFTPGRAGYSSLVLKLRASGFDSGKSIKALGVVFASDFLGRALLAATAVLYFAGKIGAGVFVFIGIVMLALGAGLFYLVAFRSQRIGRWLPKVPVLGSRLAVAYQSALDSEASLGFLLSNVGLSLVGAALRGTGWMMVFMALGLGGTEVFVATTLVSALVTALSFVPLSLAGLGLQEGAGAYLFSLAAGIVLTQAAAVMLLARVMEFGVDAALGWKELLTDWRKKTAHGEAGTDQQF
ncbi:flippase-like domain-containing protein [Candidatus Micrarchaeota archaeon]|nr:flippase-like domain-containing protein [Candidatus Micrarchaeota archaeon]